MRPPELVHVVILSGGPRINQLATRIGRSHLMLPLSPGKTILDGWNESIEHAVASVRDERNLTIASRNILVSEKPLENLNKAVGPLGWRFCTDLKSHRGTAGAISDLFGSDLIPAPVSGPGHSEWILVLEATACPAVNMGPFFIPGAREVDGCLGVSELDRLCGCILVRRRVLNSVPSLGFHDLKEQVLSMSGSRRPHLIAPVVASRAIRMVERSSFLEGVAAWSGRRRAPDGVEAGESAASVVEAGAEVSGATLISSVVCKGAVVEPGAIIARSIIGPDVIVPSGRVVSEVLVEKKASARISARWRGGVVMRRGMTHD